MTAAASHPSTNPLRKSLPGLSADGVVERTLIEEWPWRPPVTAGGQRSLETVPRHTELDTWVGYDDLTIPPPERNDHAKQRQYASDQ
jgi:hypothetical protein